MTDHRESRLQRLSAIRETRLLLLAKKRAANARKRRNQTADAAYLRYRAKLESERKAIEATGKSPYERAVERIEKLTGVSASEWEYKLSHPYVKLANRVALELCGIDQPTERAA
jgi:PAS domain-containing protein